MSTASSTSRNGRAPTASQTITLPAPSRMQAPTYTLIPTQGLSRSRAWAIVAAAWTIPGIAALSFYYLNQVVTGQAMVWSFALVSTLPNWYLWAAMTPIIVALAKRYPVDQGSWARNVLLVHVPGMVLLILLHSLANLLLFRATGLHDTVNMGLYRVHITSRLGANAIAYWSVLGIYQAFAYYRRLRSREAESAMLQVELAQAHLRALKMQLNPHFLFNTLNSITALIRKDESKKAVRMTVKLSDFLRLALENRGLYEVDLKQEVSFANRYLAIEEIRFGDRLNVEVDLGPGTEHLYVPNMLLQPIVENAIHHGIARQDGPGFIRVTARKEGDSLHISVSNSGPLPGTLVSTGTGVGLSTTRKRLERLYGDMHALELVPGKESGATVQIELPATTEPIFESSTDQLI